MTDVTRNSCLFAVTSTDMSHAFERTRSSYCCVFSTHRHQASTAVKHTQSVCPCRFVILATQESHKIPGAYGVYSCVWRLCVVFLEHGGGALGIFKSPVCTYNQAWTLSLSASHYFSFLSKRSGRRMPPAERSALYIRRNAFSYVLLTININSCSTISWSFGDVNPNPRRSI